MVGFFKRDTYKYRISLDDPDIFQSKLAPEIQNFKKDKIFSNSDNRSEKRVLETIFKLAKAQK